MELQLEALIRADEDNSIRDALDNAIQTRAVARTRTTSVDTTAQWGDTIGANATAGPINIFGPTTVGDGLITVAKVRADVSSNAINFVPSVPGQTVEGASSMAITDSRDSVTFALFGTDWQAV
jgi:hypothetical protein